MDPVMVSDKVNRSCDYDLVVIGGAFSGASTAILLKRRFKDLRVLVIEKSEIFDRKVGESTSEVAACFLTQVLKSGIHLHQEHIGKHGLRLWFDKGEGSTAGESTEIGPVFQGRLPTFQLNRLKLDAELGKEALELGCEVVKPATIKDVELGGIGKNKVTFKKADGEVCEVSAGWVVDASGKAALLARKNKTWRSFTDEHPTSAMWTRFTNVCYLDSPEGERKMMGASGMVKAQRAYSTNHLMGFGWWCWIIPLDSGEVSVGITWDERLFTPPKDGSMAERLKEHLLKHPVGKVMFEDAVAVENDNKYYKGLAYYSEETVGEGWMAVGDACGFIDPLYSQGLDFCAHTIYCCYSMLSKHFNGECVKEEVSVRSREYMRSYMHWFRALYKDKYWYMGDAELMYAAYMMDISAYFIGPVQLVYNNEEAEFSKMPYAGVIGGGVARFMRFYNRRLVKLAKKKISAGTYGDKNLGGHYLLSKSFTPDLACFKLMSKGVFVWLKNEVRYAFTKPSKELEPSMVTPLPESRDYKHA